MGIDIGTLKAIKYAATVIEKKYPGSCKKLLNSIDAVEKHPLYMVLRAKAIESKWETVKEWYTKKESLNDKERHSLFDISDSSLWNEHWREQWFKRLQS